MTHEEIELGMKVVPTSKSYASELINSTHWKKAQEIGQPYLFVNAKVVSRTKGYYYILGDRFVHGNTFYGDFFTAEDFVLYEGED